MMFTSLKNTRKGFTLIELLVVIAIIGILSSVVLASLSTARQKSRDAKRISDVGQIQLALELFFDGNQSYPSTTPGLASTASIEGGVQLLSNKNFLPQAPVPPAGGSTKYFYRGIVTAGTECAALGANDPTPCIGYFLGVNLERADNTVLASDSDTALSGTWVAYAATPATNVAGGRLVGLSQDCSAASTVAELCYDVRP